jgi:hypothetical protein
MECRITSVRLGQHGYGQYVTRIVFFVRIILCYELSKLYYQLTVFSQGRAVCVNEQDHRCVGLCVLSFVAIGKWSFGWQEEVEENRNVERICFLGFVGRQLISNWSDVKIKLTNAYKHLRVLYIIVINIIIIIHVSVSTPLLGHPQGCNIYRWYITETSKTNAQIYNINF